MMALWRRIGSAGFAGLIHCRRELYFPVGCVAGIRDFRAVEESRSQCNPIFCYAHFRSFMTSEQAKPKSKAEGKGMDWRKPKVEEDVGVRLNDAIRESEVRLVTDQGHRVVSIQEALFLAKKHDLDLVEVQKKVKITGGSQSPVFKPAVCKLMDYYKEKYKQDLKEKERAKSHSIVTLRNGENKEVRFKAKTELKDLKIKAETVKRLMERGYRVKCTATHSGKDDEDLGALLLSLLQLIEDISVVESGPHLDPKNAYVIVKHIKFSKKGGKANKAMESVKSILSSRPSATTDASSADQVEGSPAEEWETVESDSEPENEAPAKPLLDDIKTESTSISKQASSIFGGTKPEQAELSNRYNRRSNEAAPAGRDGAFPGRFSGGNRGRMTERTGSNGSNNRSQWNPNDRPGQFHNPDYSANRGSVIERTGSNGSNGPGLFNRNDRPGRNFNPDSSPPPRYATFKPSQASDPQQRFGVFSSTKPSPLIDDPANKPKSATPSYGIFGSSNTASSDEKSSDRSSPSPRFGNFGASKKTQ